MQNARAPNNPWGEEDWVVSLFRFCGIWARAGWSIKKKLFYDVFFYTNLDLIIYCCCISLMANLHIFLRRC